MAASKADPVVRLVTAIVSFMYFALLVLAAVMVIAVVGMELWVPRDALTKFTLGVSAKAHLREMAIASAWGAPLALHDARVEVAVPVSAAPAAFRAVTYVGVAVALVLVLLFFHHLRQIFLRVREGVPFDARNAARVRALGLLLLAVEVVSTALGYWQVRIMLRGITDTQFLLSTPLIPDQRMMFIALVLIALAEVFRRGTTLEDEQSLVV